ncbi:hypothetical protein ACIBG7_27055 [Nonomuraea sp. NPDC050328]|uniref:hypothetical protein n=1 Tax=Nonomuraea sp. NPDC050328 TaxID=3364361 RepID=UPI0037B2E6C0
MIVSTQISALRLLAGRYIRDRTLEGHESARTRGKHIGGATVTDEIMLSMALLHLRDRSLSLRDIAARLVIIRGKKEEGQHPSPATVLRRLRDHDEAAGRPAMQRL